MKVLLYFSLFFSLLSFSSCLFDNNDNSEKTSGEVNEEPTEGSQEDIETHPVTGQIFWLGESCQDHEVNFFHVAGDSVFLDSLVPASLNHGDMKLAEYPKEDCIGYYMEYSIDSSTNNRNITRISAELQTFAEEGKDRVSAAPLYDVKQFDDIPSGWGDVYAKSDDEEWGCYLEQLGYVALGDDTLYVADYYSCDIYSEVMLDPNSIISSSSDLFDSLDIDRLFRYIVHDYFWMDDTRNRERIQLGFMDSRSWGSIAPLNKEKWTRWTSDMHLPSKKYWVEWNETDANGDTVYSVQDSLSYHEEGFAYCYAPSDSDIHLNTDVTNLIRPDLSLGYAYDNPENEKNRCRGSISENLVLNYEDEAESLSFDVPFFAPFTSSSTNWELMVFDYPFHNEDSFFQNP